jgi:hypothetical protein
MSHGRDRGRRLLLLTAAVFLTLVATAPAASLAAEEDDTGSHACELAPPWLQPACYLTSGGSGGDGLLGGVISSGAEAALRSIVEWVVGGAAWLLGQLVGLIDSATRPDVTQGWFTVAYADMVLIGALVMLPLLVVSAIQAVLRQSLAHLARAAFVYVPVACVGMFAAVVVVDQLVTITDELSAWISRSTGSNLAEFAQSVGEALVATGMQTGNSTAGVALPGFATLLAAAVIGFASFVIWVLLVLRQAAIYVAVLFLPLAFAALVWPVTAHWLRRLLEGLVAIVMSKFVIVAVMGLASGALNAIGDEGFPVLISGGALLLLASFAPFVLLRLIPVFESGLASQLDGTTTSRTSPVPGPTAGGVYRGVQRARTASAARGVGTLGGVAGPAAVAGAAVAAGGGSAVSTIAHRALATSSATGGAGGAGQGGNTTGGSGGEVGSRPGNGAGSGSGSGRTGGGVPQSGGQPSGAAPPGDPLTGATGGRAAGTGSMRSPASGPAHGGPARGAGTAGPGKPGETNVGGLSPGPLPPPGPRSVRE